MSKKKSVKIFSAVLISILLIISAVLTYFTGSWRSIINLTDSNSSSVYEVVKGEAQQKPLCVNYIDVGQGDCSLIKFNNYNILIDCAKSSHESEVLDFLNLLDVKNIDLAIETHPDSDHIGGFSYVFSNIKCSKFLMPQIPDSFKKTDTEYTLLSTLKTYNIKTEYALNNKTYKFGDLCLTTYLSFNNHEDKNDYSIITKIKYKNASYLFMGDASNEVEDELMNRNIQISSDILKVGHHGSNKSTSDSFLAFVKPRVAVFSCGLNNEYGHPSNKVIENVTKYNISIARTDTQGTIAIGTDGQKYYFASEKG